MAGQGDFELSPPFKKFEVDIDVWSGMSNESRTKHFNRFMKKKWLAESRTVTSSDGAHVFTGPGTMGGKKPNQKKRKRNAKTTTKTKKQKF